MTIICVQKQISISCEFVVYISKRYFFRYVRLRITKSNQSRLLIAIGIANIFLNSQPLWRLGTPFFNLEFSSLAWRQRTRVRWKKYAPQWVKIINTYSRRILNEPSHRRRYCFCFSVLSSFFRSHLIARIVKIWRYTKLRFRLSVSVCLWRKCIAEPMPIEYRYKIRCTHTGMWQQRFRFMVNGRLFVRH